MTDTHTKEQRSENMRAIRSKNTTPELLIRSALHRKGYRFRLHCSYLPGKPDIVLPRYRTAIDVRGCFWHRHPGCRKATTPSTNADYWKEKFRRNVQRDRKNKASLQKMGWKTIVVWECETADMDEMIKRLHDKLERNKLSLGLKSAGREKR